MIRICRYAIRKTQKVRNKVTKVVGPVEPDQHNNNINLNMNNQ